MKVRIVRVSPFHLAILGLLISCGDDQGPTDVTFDVAGTAQALTAVRNVVTSSALDAHLALAPRFIPPDPSPTSARQAMAVGQQIPILPTQFLGTTFALEDGDGTYQPTQMMGAPENALRFLLYAVDTSGDPLAGTAIGHADLTDEGVEMENGFAVDIAVRIDDLVIADYTTSFDAGGSSAGLTRVVVFDHVGLNIAGHLRTGTDAFEFNMVTGTVNEVVTTEFAFGSGDATINGQVMEEPDSELRVLQAELQLGADRLNVTANGIPNSFGAAITVNGTDWAMVIVEPESVTATGSQGRLDSTEESIALRLAEYFLFVPNLASSLVPGLLTQ